MPDQMNHGGLAFHKRHVQLFACSMFASNKLHATKLHERFHRLLKQRDLILPVERRLIHWVRSDRQDP